MIRYHTLIFVLIGLVSGCGEGREPVRPVKTRVSRPPATVPAEQPRPSPPKPALDPPTATEQESYPGLPLVIQIDDVPEVPEELQGPSPPIEEDEKKE